MSTTVFEPCPNPAGNCGSRTHDVTSTQMALCRRAAADKGGSKGGAQRVSVAPVLSVPAPSQAPLVRLDTTAENKALSFLLQKDDDGTSLFDTDQPYQRGSVWGPERKQNLIRSLMEGIPVPAIVVNNRHGGGFDHYSGEESSRNYKFAIVDGKQRSEAIRGFLDSEFGVPASWFSDGDIEDLPQGDDLVHFDQLTTPIQRDFRQMTTIGVVGAKMSSLAQEEHLFNMVNYGGVPQGESDL